MRRARLCKLCEFADRESPKCRPPPRNHFVRGSRSAEASGVTMQPQSHPADFERRTYGICRRGKFLCGRELARPLHPTPRGNRAPQPRPTLRGLDARQRLVPLHRQSWGLAPRHPPRGGTAPAPRSVKAMSAAGLFHCSVKSVGRGNGASVIQKAAYRAGVRLIESGRASPPTTGRGAASTRALSSRARTRRHGRTPTTSGGCSTRRNGRSRASTDAWPQKSCWHCRTSWTRQRGASWRSILPARLWSGTGWRRMCRCMRRTRAATSGTTTRISCLPTASLGATASGKSPTNGRLRRRRRGRRSRPKLPVSPPRRPTFARSGRHGSATSTGLTNAPGLISGLTTAATKNAESSRSRPSISAPPRPTWSGAGWRASAATPIGKSPNATPSGARWPGWKTSRRKSARR